MALEILNNCQRLKYLLLKIVLQVRDFGILWTLYQYRTSNNWRRKSRGNSPASTSRLGIGDDLKAPAASLIPALCIGSNKDSLALVAEEYTSHP